MMTVSITWITPLDAFTSTATTVALSTCTLPSIILTLIDPPWAVFSVVALTTLSAVYMPGTTWYLRMAWSLARFSGFSKEATVPSGSFAKAASVGTKTVNGPSPLRVSTRPAAFAAVSSVPKSPADLCIHALNQLRSLLPEPEADAPAAVGGAPPGDPYVLPTLTVAIALTSLGWRSISLGPDTPFDSLRIAAADAGAPLAWLSVSAECDAGALAKQVEHLADQLAPSGTTLVIGGRALPKPFPLRSENVLLSRSLSELAAYVQGLRASAQRGPVSSLAR
jgi:hypothetical protein